MTILWKNTSIGISLAPPPGSRGQIAILPPVQRDPSSTGSCSARAGCSSSRTALRTILSSLSRSARSRGMTHPILGSVLAVDPAAFDLEPALSDFARLGYARLGRVVDDDTIAALGA